MRATLNIPDALIDELVRETGEKNKTKIIKTALEDLLRKVKRNKFKKLRGKIDLDIDLKEFRGRDMIIAAHCSQHGFTLIEKDKHFHQIKDLMGITIYDFKLL